MLFRSHSSHILQEDKSVLQVNVLPVYACFTTEDIHSSPVVWKNVGWDYVKGRVGSYMDPQLFYDLRDHILSLIHI